MTAAWRPVGCFSCSILPAGRVTIYFNTLEAARGFCERLENGQKGRKATVHEIDAEGNERLIPDEKPMEK